MRTGFFTTCVLALVSSTGMAWSASLVSVDGPVSVNNGQGFKPITEAVVLRPGDVVMASPGGSAKLSYDDGCVVGINAGSVVPVRATSPCAKLPEPMGATGSIKGSEQEIREDHTGHYLLTGAAIAGGAVGIYYLTKDDDDDKPASP